MPTNTKRAKPRLNENKLKPRPARWPVQKSARPRFSGDEIRAQLQNYDRKPFIDLLTEWISACPDPSTVAAFAEKHPDKYISALSNLARIAGFTEKTEASVDITVNYRALSDSQLEDKLAEMSRYLNISLAVRGDDSIIEHSSEEVVSSTADSIIGSLQKLQKSGKPEPETE